MAEGLEQGNKYSGTSDIAGSVGQTKSVSWGQKNAPNGGIIQNADDLMDARRQGLNVKDKVKEAASGMTREDIKQLMKQLNRGLKKQEESIKQQKKAIENDNKLSNEQKKARQDELDAQLQQIDATRKESGVQGNELKNALTDGLGKLGTQMRGAIDGVIESNRDYRRQINTRLQGFGDDIDKFTGYSLKISSNFAANTLISSKNLMRNLNDAVSKGIAMNVEQRAFLQTVKEEIADTFDAFNGNLTRIIRLQQADSTAMRLGLESSVTTMLNSYFGDSAYMTDIGTSNIAGALIEAESSMSSSDAANFEFAVQKWLGSLYALGMSQSGVESIATALGQIGSGNVTAVSNEMQNLFAMASTKGGSPYADILTDGLDASNVNILLKNVVDYLSEIATDTNNVVRTAHGSVFGMSISDLQAASNLSSMTTTVANTQANLLGQLGSMIGEIDERIGFIGMLGNLKDNLQYSVANTIAGTGIGYLLYTLITNVGDLIDFAIPTINAAGFGLSFEGTKVTDMINAGIGGFSILAGIGNVAASLFSGNGLNNFNENWWVPAGSGYSGLDTTGVSLGSSKSYSGGGGNDIQRSEIGDATDTATDVTGQQAESAPDSTTDDIMDNIDRLYNALFADRKAILVDVNTMPLEPITVKFDDSFDMAGAFRAAMTLGG